MWESFFAGCTFVEEGTARNLLRGISAPFHCISFCSELTVAFRRQRNVKGCIDISVVNVPTLGALELLTVSVAHKSAAATLFASRMGINIGYLHSPQPGFIFNKLMKLMKRPAVQGVFT